ncbi:MAG: hypothetical protein ACE5FI_03915 [Anaerolineales bacterium]
MSLAKRQVQRISRDVYKQFPELKGTEPRVTQQRAPASARVKQAKSAGANGADRYLLTFNGRSTLPNGRSIIRIVRVISDGRGNVIKITTSR